MQRQSSTIGGYDTFASEIKQDGNQIGEKEYFERREHDKLHEKLDFIMSQLTRVDRNVKKLFQYNFIDQWRVHSVLVYKIR